MGDCVPVRTVTIPGCLKHQGIYSITVTVKWTCPRCGAPRGEVKQVTSFDGTLRLLVDGWTNDCGHKDKYDDVRREAAGMPLVPTAADAAEPPHAWEVRS